jgi:hypothetical protein
MIPKKYLVEIRKNWVVANIGLILIILGFTIWIPVLFSPIAQAYNHSRQFKDATS